MTNIGFVGLGRLGMPVALAMSLSGHRVIGTDLDVKKCQKDSYPFPENTSGGTDFPTLLKNSTLSFSVITQIVAECDIIFVAVQTPHSALYEGTTRLPDTREDFWYGYLKAAVKHLSDTIKWYGKDRIVAIISTVLPGTIRREILPTINDHVKLCYTPAFIALGNTLVDFLSPAYSLIGTEDDSVAKDMREFYSTIHESPVHRTNFEEAELIKAGHNALITTKICFANTMMELCHKIGNCDVDTVNRVLAGDDTHSRAGMPDGGPCRPRDVIALSWLARKHKLSWDWFESLGLCREMQAEFIVNVAREHHARKQYGHNEIGICGQAYKAYSTIKDGSPSVLVGNLLTEGGYDVRYYEHNSIIQRAGVYIVGTMDSGFFRREFPDDSVVIDPWRCVFQGDRFEVISLGGYGT